mmetsp:Transcript_62222/g.113843  ORF Transcript_62222/g.113843 Transcript_62222/m.113843 type:complete len:268 (+) Transcript_62222:134-937(+)
MKSEHSSYFGTWQGDCMGRCAILVPPLLHGARAHSWECWCCFSDAKVETPSGWPMLTNVSPQPDSQICVKLRLEWREMVRDVNMHKESLLRGDAGDCQFNCLLLVGVEKLKGIQFQKGEQFWVEVSKHGYFEKKQKATPKKRAQISEVREESWPWEAKTFVTWETPLVFRIEDPRKDKIELTVQTATGGGAVIYQASTIGSITKDVSTLLAKQNCNQEFHEQVSSGETGLRTPVLKFVMRLWIVGPIQSDFPQSSTLFNPAAAPESA